MIFAFVRHPRTSGNPALIFRPSRIRAIHPRAWMPSCANTDATRKKVFLGDFFSPPKKLPALMRGSSCFKARHSCESRNPVFAVSQRDEELDPGFSRDDEERQKWKIKVTGFRLSQE
jgi:hypothetical protein